MPGGTPCSRWSGLPAKMILMRLISRHQRLQIGDLNGGPARSTQQFSGDRRAKANPRKSTLEPQASASLRHQLTTELKDLISAEDAANWAHRVLGTKNTLTTADAERVEQAFQARLASM